MSPTAGFKTSLVFLPRLGSEPGIFEFFALTLPLPWYKYCHWSVLSFQHSITCYASSRTWSWTPRKPRTSWATSWLELLPTTASRPSSSSPIRATWRIRRPRWHCKEPPPSSPWSTDSWGKFYKFILQKILLWFLQVKLYILSVFTCYECKLRLTRVTSILLV